MAILKIARMGHPVLVGRAAEVEDPTAPEVRRLVSDMLETMADADGVGLAAPQVYVARRIVIFRAPPDDERADDEESTEPAPLTVLINPVIEPLSDETVVGWEGCLSLPELRGLVPRYTRIRYSGLTPEGATFAREALGFHARVVQHECDHLDGMLYPRRMTDLASLVYLTEWKYHFEADDEAPAAAGEIDDG
jgi:peptide deformylase